MEETKVSVDELATELEWLRADRDWLRGRCDELGRELRQVTTLLGSIVNVQDGMVASLKRIADTIYGPGMSAGPEDHGLTLVIASDNLEGTERVVTPKVG